MSKDDLIDVQGTVVAVHSGGLYRVQCDQGHEVLAQLSGRMRRFRIKVVPGDRVTVGVSPYDPSAASSPSALAKSRFEFPYQHTTRPPRRRRPVARGGASRGAVLGRTGRAGARTAARSRAPRPTYDPEPVAFDTPRPRAVAARRHPASAASSTTTPIQSAVIPIVMSGDDLIGCADTGTGKTAAFLLPILNRLLRARAAAPEERGYTRVLILAPTRELARADRRRRRRASRITPTSPASRSTAACRWTSRSARSSPASTSSSRRPAG